ncbi:P-loop containing nucleoside triphosphate hydrolase protein [Crepidotus variabilis]|uniref:P-loop containing nucleoside triphosphate hydrolase protein n=1 Tax=Crepidotus variabilis TaxID=179855 RepID=A0A9P6JMB8_9AGAR|nr:P-loop containing nucleoside triphosphate hydrolase protein [Crepidotus variabilis]
MAANNPRARGLQQIFFDIISGKQSISRFNAEKFLESVYNRPEPVTCVDKITASENGLKAIRQALTTQLDSPAFFNGHVASFLAYFDHPDLRLINGGQYLNNIVLQICEPPIFWDAFRRAFINGRLHDNAKASLGWLLLQLCSLPSDQATPYRQHEDTAGIVQSLLAPSASLAMLSVGRKLKQVLDASISLNSVRTAAGLSPGGRHDNDFEDFRTISILPTTDEVASSEPAFLRPASVLEDPSTKNTRVSIHLDNQFRLLREDMLYEIREELQLLFGTKKGFHRGVKITDLFVKDIECGDENKWAKFSLVVICNEDIPVLDRQKTAKQRKDYLKEHPKFLKHQSLACLVSGTEIIAFPTIIRDEDRLSESPPKLVLQFDGSKTTQRALQKLKTDSNVFLVQIDTAIFSYEPVLKRLQEATTLPLASELLLWEKGAPVGKVASQATYIVNALQTKPDTNLKPLLDTPTDIVLDPSQTASLISGLTQKLSLLQGPPGTGKSFIGAILAKVLFEFTEKTILVVCYTNHALDDILEGLLKIGLPQEKMLRLGGKSTATTEPLTIHRQMRQNKRSRDQWLIIDEYKRRLKLLHDQLKNTFNQYNADRITYQDIFGHIEFSDPTTFAALQVPRFQDSDGMTVVDHRGRSIDRFYLLKRWRAGQDAGIFTHDIQDPELVKVWNQAKPERERKWMKWEEAILDVDIEDLCTYVTEYNQVHGEFLKAQNTEIFPLLQSKRVVGCTTTAAAKYSDEIQAFNPDILLVEEAGEILESHVLTAMGPETSQIILIGDHKQLRPKVNNYLLTVEKEEGYDLNRSLFERLILREYPHNTLTEQHRMRPEISTFVRQLTYPELVDANSTQNRPDVRGVSDNIIFIHHEHPEGDDSISDRRDMTTTSSKHNAYEVQMVLKIVKYLGQQGYGTDDLVILTPYLGQLSKLRQALKADNDPILNDLDSFDLVRAGLLSQSEAKLTKKPIRLATIDNYQGEESDIVVVSLTRSNPKNDIGFMFAPERLNVLLSRSRNGLIMIGNFGTFKNARKGKELWTQLFEQFSHNKHIYEGFPVRCERHMATVSLVQNPDDFDTMCPDGGCNLPCGVLLSCGTHKCPSKCHAIVDHSKMKCNEPSSSRCLQGHLWNYVCADGPPVVCQKCERETKLRKKKQDQEYLATQRREAEQRDHLRRMDELESQVSAALRSKEDARLATERKHAIQQKEFDLQALLTSTHSSPLVATGPTANIINPLQQQQPPLQQHSTLPQLPSAQEPTSLDRRDASPINIITSNRQTNIQPLSPATRTPAPPNPRPPAKPFPALKLSQSKTEWERQKAVLGISNAAVDAIMGMTGLEDIKAHILALLAKIDVTKRQGASLKRERFNAVLLGNPGTGKTTVARYFAQLLASLDVIPTATFRETTGAALSHEGVDGTKKLLDEVIKSGGGTIFVDEAYQLTSGNNPQGSAVLDYLLAEMENNVGTLVFLLAGYNREMEKFFEHNPGLRSRVPVAFQFADYKDEELMAMFDGLVITTFSGRMKVEDGNQGLFSRVFIRRLGRRRGRPGFANARELQSAFALVRGRQAKRLSECRKAGVLADDFFLAGEDLIGPDPSKAVLKSQSWTKLQTLIGLQSVKQSVKSLFHIIQENYKRELVEKEPLELSLNRVFLGSPGTGKTTVAKLYGQIMADLGLLSNGEVVVKNPADFVGAYLGQSEAQTKAILANSVGKVLIIDEAYMLYGGGGDSAGSNNNQFKTAVIDTIVAEVQNVPGEDRCVLMLGYKDQMQDMFQNVNPGLARRFKIEEAFDFEDFDDVQLLAILELKLHDQDLDATAPAKKVAVELLSRMRNRPNFGNAGEVENLITSAKQRCVARRSLLPSDETPVDIIFDPEDFDPDFNRGATASTNLIKLFEDIVGHQDTMQLLKNYQDIAQTCKIRGLDFRGRIPTTFVFTGPPGTGKTTIARKMGQVFYDMGLLSSSAVIECSASDLVGQYVGQTGPKTRKLFEKAAGKVLFIDEAYQLSSGHFAQEAVDELVRLLTLDTVKGKMIVILAGYENDMKNLMQVNSGLSSRFPTQVYFKDMDADHCLQVIKKELQRQNVLLPGLDDETSELFMDMREMVCDLAELNDWGNARDMMTFSTELVNQALLGGGGTGTTLQLSEEEALDVLRKILLDRQRRSKSSGKKRQQPNLPVQSSAPDPPTPPPTNISTNAETKPPPAPPASPPNSSRASSPASVSSRGRGGGRGRGRGRGRGGHAGPSPRVQPTLPGPSTPVRTPGTPQKDPINPDPGVSKEIWQQLLAAKHAEGEAAKKSLNTMRLWEQREANERQQQEAQKMLEENLAKQAAQERDAQRRLELQRLREEARLREQAARRAREKAIKEIAERKERERQEKEKEAKAQKKLRELGVCPVGYRWICMGDYYRCAGGSHTVSVSQLGL